MEVLIQASTVVAEAARKRMYDVKTLELNASAALGEPCRRNGNGS